MTEFEVKELNQEEVGRIEQICYDSLHFIHSKLPKNTGYTAVNLILNVLMGNLAIFMQKTIDPENFHDFADQIEMHMRRTADHCINQLKAKEQDASQSTNHNTKSNTSS